jgi:hypothetical protein
MILLQLVLNICQTGINNIDGVIVSVLASCAVHRGFDRVEPKTPKLVFVAFLRLARSIKEKEQRLLGSESG